MTLLYWRKVYKKISRPKASMELGIAPQRIYTIERGKTLPEGPSKAEIALIHLGTGGLVSIVDLVNEQYYRNMYLTQKLPAMQRLDEWQRNYDNNRGKEAYRNAKLHKNKRPVSV